MTQQIGGDHYQTGAYQHWDWSIDVRIMGLPYAATKYIARHRRKHGRQDLEKALSYVQKQRSDDRAFPSCTVSQQVIIDRTQELALQSGMTPEEHRLCLWIATAVDPDDLIEAESTLELMISNMPRDTEEAAMRSYASGGIVKSDRQYLVGERGPEAVFREDDGPLEMLGAGRTEHPAPFGYDGNG